MSKQKGYAANGMAFQKQEVREGMSLEYVAEKIRHTIESAHSTVREIKKNVPDDFPIPSHFPDNFLGRDVFSAKNDLLLSPAKATLRSSIIAFIALKNMLNLPGISDDLVDRAEFLSRKELDERLDFIEREGSVT